MNRRRLLTLGGAIGLSVTTGAAVYAAGQAHTPSQRAAQAAPPEPSVVTAPVKRGRLADETVVEGRLQRAVTVNVPAPAAVDGGARLVVTRLAKKVGASVASGDVLLEVSGRPMLVLRGSFPAYRDLKHGMTGPDVKQLQEALRPRYGTPRTGRFDSRTEADLRRLYVRVGYEPAFAEVQAAASPAPVAGTPAPTRQVILPAGEVVFVPSLPVQISALPARVGGAAEGTVASLASGAWRVFVPLDDEAERFLNGGTEPAAITLEDGPAADNDTKLVEIVTKPAEGQTPESREAVFSMPGSVQARPGDPQRIRLTRARSEPDSLIVPVSALWTATDGTVCVNVVQGAGQRTVPVKVLLSVRGEAAVTGELVEGERVVVSRNG
ncbi:hypothetical protein AB0B66_22455 [Catellatospora sp. NPDC049111]|uniref:hypothetical protein n=1 Tax=Catellatospora sp. NPDC049111 TaxID=3155271 RepID=UPI0033F183B0